MMVIRQRIMSEDENGGVSDSDCHEYFKKYLKEKEERAK